MVGFWDFQHFMAFVGLLIRYRFALHLVFALILLCLNISVGNTFVACHEQLRSASGGTEKYPGGLHA
jgi:hypothetical protein